MSELVSMLRRELATLEAELRSDPRYAKIERIKALLQEYEPPMAASRFIQASMPMEVRMAPGRGKSSKAELVRVALQGYLRERSFAGRKELLEHATRAGLMGHEEHPMKQLSTYLSRFPEFISDGDGKWRLRKIADMTEPPSDSPDGGHSTAQ